MHSYTRVLALLLVSFLWGCASLTPPDPQLLAQVEDFELVSAREDAFLASPDALARLQDMQSYGAEVAVLFDTQSLRLGPLGSALTTKYDVSLSGHLVLDKFYRALGEPAAEKHAEWVERIKNYTSHGRDGTLENPYRVLTIEEAHAFILSQDKTVIGSMYGENETYPLIAYIVTRDQSGFVSKAYFEITAFERWRELTRDPANAQPVDVIRALASAQDNSAQVAYGAYLLENADTDPKRRNEIERTGRQWLSMAMSSANALPPYFLANYAVANRTNGVDWGTVKSNYERAMQLGYTDANVNLGKLYLQGVFGDQERLIGIELLEEAAELDNVDAATSLGSILMSQAPKDAINYLRQAAELGDDRHRLTYVRNVLQQSQDRHLDDMAFQWLSDLASNDNQEAMVLLGSVYAKGLYEDKTSIRRARSWYRRSVEVKPNHGRNVNEVAWVLATTHLKRLRNPTLAIKYMDNLMTTNEDARTRPGYIDTWAAAYAAAGDFQRAIELQEEALAIADQIQMTEVKEVLESHLQDYKESKALTEEVP